MTFLKVLVAINVKRFWCFKKRIEITDNPDHRPVVNQYWNIVFQLYIVGPVLFQFILRVCCYLIRIHTFFSENRLSILGFDSNDVHSKIMENCENFEKNYEILGDALFEHDDAL